MEVIMGVGFIIIGIVYILVSFYLAHRNLGWLKAIWHVFSKLWFRILYYIIAAGVAILPLLSFTMSNGSARRIVSLIGYYELGVFLYTFLFVVILDILRGIIHLLRLNKSGWMYRRWVQVTAGALVFLLIVGVCGYGFYHARQLQVKEYDVTVDKTVDGAEGITIALISDLHLGYNIGTEQLQKIVDQVNAMDADIVLIAGDIFDNNYEAMADPDGLITILQELKSTYGTYACYGNHDVDASQEITKTTQKEDNRFTEFLEQANVTLLRDEAKLINYQVYIVGRLDSSPLGVSGTTRKSANLLLRDLKQDVPIIVLDHQPSDLDSLDMAGADLVLSGHTHNGQLFPGNLLVNLLYTNAYGYYEGNHMQSIVTSGAGLWGPYMRVGTDCEVVKINVKFGDTNQD
jgi:predicted MPP superfamily phosphohydrolase